MSFQFFRRFFYETHLWLGIVSGIVLFIVCLSGLPLVFQDEIRRFAEPTKYYVDVPKEKTALSADELIAKVEAAKPGIKVASITIPEKPNRTVSMNMASPNQRGGERGGPGGPRGERRERIPRDEGSRGNRGGGEGRGGRGPRVEGEQGSRPEGDRGMRAEGGRGQRPEGRRSEWTGRNSEGRTEAGTPGREGNHDSQAAMATTGQGGRPGGPQGGPPQRGGGGGHGRGRNAVYVNPYTGEIVGEGANKVDPFLTSMMQLHRWLLFSGESQIQKGGTIETIFRTLYLHSLLGESQRGETTIQWRMVGKLIVGIATLVFVVICLTGLVLWLPRTWISFKKWRAWKSGFRIRFRNGFWPFLYDTHNTIGFYLLIPALILALTGLCWSFSWYRTGANYVLGTPVLQRGGQSRMTIEPPVEESVTPLSVSEMIGRQNELTPGIGEIVVSIPQDRETPMTIQKGGTGFFSLAIKDKTQWDRFRGTVIPVEHHGKTVEVERFVDKPLGAQIAGSIRAVHFGNITGMSSKIFFFIVCLFATSWPVTGIMLWIKKLRAKYKKRKAAKEAAQVDAIQGGSLQPASHHQPTGEMTTNVGQTV